MTTVGFSPVGGLEIYTRSVAEGLRDIGHEVTVWAILEQGSELAGVAVREFRPSSRLVTALHYRTLRIRLGNLVSGQRSRFDLILCMHPRLAPGVARGVASGGPPFWIWTYGTDIWGPWDPGLQHAIHAAEKVATISRFTAERILSHSPALDVPVVFPTVDASKFALSTDPPAPTQDPVLLTVSRIDETDAYKGHDNTIRSIPLIESSLGRRIIYRIAGSGNGCQRLRAIAREHGVEDRTVFLGRIDDQRLAREYRECDLFAMPSRMDPAPDGSLRGEGFGIVYIEAQATGRPVVVSQQAAAPETILPGETGLAVDPFAPEDIARACVSILSLPDRGRAMGLTGRAFVSNAFGTDKFRQRLSSLFGGG